ncbi:glycosyltransferase [Caballeronia telluris]|uniref:Group 1 glycosyl transferase n=1 Tax=Caballeronia telluris TaxID=326475 RepID=A0A158GK67_9BURK|nr:glycosyltransferase [Caballeronia telluris]SAL32514.1 group 1 glycosyl transferase [Caballeronia telluris]
MDAISESLLNESGPLDETTRTRVVWFLGPRPASWNGVMRYSLDCLEMMKTFDDFTVESIDIPAEPRSLKRYWTHFVLYPLRAMLAARSADLIVLYQEDMAYMIPFVRLARGKVCIVMHHVIFPDRTRGIVETLKARYMRMLQPLIAKADLVVSTTGVTVSDGIEELGIKPDRIELVPNAFDERIVPVDAGVRERAREHLREKLGVAIGDESVFLNVGTDETRKNNAVVFRAMAELGRKDVMMLRVGKAQNAANRKECEDIARNAGIKAHFIEGASDEDLAFCYQAADVYVSPTLHEGFGRTVIEAQLVGLPVIASDLPVYRFTMADSFLAVSEPTRTAGWRREIERILKDEHLRRTLAQSGRANARRFSSAAVSADLHRALRRATQRQV